MTTTNPNDAARALSLLVRSDDDALAYYGVRARLAERVPLETLRWWRGFLMDLVAKLADEDTEALDRYQEGLEGLRESGESSSAEPSPGRAEPPPPSPPSPPPRPPRAPAQAPAVAVPEPTDSRPSSEGIDGTSFLSALELDDAAARQPLPFAGTHAAPERLADALDDPASVGETASVDLSALQAELERANVDIDVDTYAAIVAQTEQASPEQRRRVYAQYGIDQARRVNLDTLFAVQFQSDPGTKARFDESLKRWRDWLKAGGGS